MEGEKTSVETGRPDRPRLQGEEDKTIPIAQEPTSDPATAFMRSSEGSDGTPARLGDHEILEEIARGGMGVVFKARHVHLNRIVALKVIITGSQASEKLTERFQREARAAARLEHPGIVQIYDLGHERGVDYFTMRLVEGDSLAQAMEDPDTPVEKSLGWIREVCAAVHHAHTQGIFHRDLKPSNILIENNGRPVVTDFGLAKDRHQLTMTGTGDILGTPSYMAPEQVGAEEGLIDARTDVYSLGVILYQIASGGELPFQADTPMQMMYQVANDAPIPLALKNPRFRTDLVTIVEKAMSREKRDRYSSAGALGTDLARYLAGEKLAARPAGLLERIVRYYRKNLTVVNLAALLLLCVGIIYTLLQSNRRDSADQKKPRAGQLAVSKTRPNQKTTRKPLVAKTGRKTTGAPRSKSTPFFKGFTHAGKNAQGYHEYDKQLPRGVTLRFVLIPAGTFLMGSPRTETGSAAVEWPQHEVTLARFLLAKYEVTQKQWRAVMGNNPAKHKADNLPVETVSWIDCQLFCGKVGLNLPSESQWEYARRAGAQIDGRYLWYDKNSGLRTHPVGTKLPNGFGLHDMAGNVWEWCEDSWHRDYNGAPRDGSSWFSPAASGHAHAVRGGSFDGPFSYSRCANRFPSSASRRSRTLGFRPCRRVVTE